MRVNDGLAGAAMGEAMADSQEPMANARIFWCVSRARPMQGR